MKIDAHLHVNFRNYSAKDIIDYLDKNQFDCCWLMTWEEISPAKWHYEHLSIDDVYKTYLRYPSRIIPMYAPDPHRVDASEKLTYWYGKGIRGCAELKATLSWQSKKVRNLLSTVSILRLPLVFHMQESNKFLAPLESDNSISVLIAKLMRTDRLLGITKRILNVVADYYSPLGKWRNRRGNWFPGYMMDFASLANALNDYPNINFIGHGPLFWKHISADATTGGPIYPKGPVKEGGITCKFLRGFPNLYADISGVSGFNALNRDYDFAKSFLQEFKHKLLFGTDNTLGHEKLLESFNLPVEMGKKIYGENAATLIGNIFKT
jgi:predicted TIM-barrel fold metal-dependent hydrolase